MHRLAALVLVPVLGSALAPIQAEELVLSPGSTALVLDLLVEPLEGSSALQESSPPDASAACTTSPSRAAPGSDPIAAPPPPTPPPPPRRSELNFLGGGLKQKMTFYKN